MENLKGKYVCVRSNLSGVWMGEVVEITPAGHMFTMTLTDAHKIHVWEGAAATSGLALHGPGKGSRVCEPVDEALVGDVFEVLHCTPQARNTVRKIEKWKA